MSPVSAGPILLLVNPAAGRGSAAARADAVAQALAVVGDVQRENTRGPGDETRIAQDAAAMHARALVVVGGDGSVSRAARGLVDAKSQVPLAIVGAGTGNDFAKSINAPSHNVPALVERLRLLQTRAVDVGFVDDVPFVNAAGFGFDVHVLERMRSPGLLRGTAAYVGTALRALVGYRGFGVRLAGDSGPQERLMLVFANGRYFGGAFHIAPSADIDDGQLDMVAIADAPPLRRVSLFAKAVRGTHLSAPEVRWERGTRFPLHFDAPPAFEADGELHQAQSDTVTISVRPGALQVVT